MVAVTNQHFDCARIDLDVEAEGMQALPFALHHLLANLSLNGVAQTVKDHFFRDSCHQFGAESLIDTAQDRPFDGSEGGTFHPHCFARADVRGENDIVAAEILSFAIGQRDPSSIEDLQKQIEYQRMRFFHFVEKQRAAIVLGQSVTQHPRFGCGASEEQADRGLILKFRHVETVQVASSKDIIAKADGYFCLTDTSWADE